MVSIHPTAIISPGATIAEKVKIGPYCVVGENAVLRTGVELKSHVVVEGNTEIGEGTIVFPFASIGAKPQDLKYRGEKTFVRIGRNCEIRENVTINSSCGEGTEVRIGDDCLLMAYVHVAHNCILGNGVILANNVSLAGHVEIGNFAIVGGFTPIHQYTRVGDYAMCGGMSRLDGDLGPFLIGGGTEFKVGGLNLVGLKRRGFDLERRIKLNQLFKAVYRSSWTIEEALLEIRSKFDPIDPDVSLWLDFYSTTKRGFAGYKLRMLEEPVGCS